MRSAAPSTRASVASVPRRPRSTSSTNPEHFEGSPRAAAHAATELLDATAPPVGSQRRGRRAGAFGHAAEERAHGFGGARARFPTELPAGAARVELREPQHEVE